jgi:hypothetical protein
MEVGLASYTSVRNFTMHLHTTYDHAYIASIMYLHVYALSVSMYLAILCTNVSVRRCALE